MGKLIMVRHGESEGNAIRRFTTSGEAKITELGRRQALEAAVRIKLKFQPILVIASTFARARETGLIIASELGIPIEYEERFREMSLGDLAGKPYELDRQRSHLRSQALMGVACAERREPRGCDEARRSGA